MQPRAVQSSGMDECRHREKKSNMRTCALLQRLTTGRQKADTWLRTKAVAASVHGHHATIEIPHTAFAYILMASPLSAHTPAATHVISWVTIGWFSWFGNFSETELQGKDARAKKVRRTWLRWPCNLQLQTKLHDDHQSCTPCLQQFCSVHVL